MICQQDFLDLLSHNRSITGNSFYGYTIMNKAKHMKVDIVDEKTASDLINSPRFSTLDELGEDCYEVIIVYYFLGEIFLPAINFS